jgi:hypothetical protein
MIAENAVVLLTSRNADNTTFGSGFVIAEDTHYSYVLSCAHVVEDIGNKPCIAGLPVDILAMGSADGLDMALLTVAKLNKPCLNQFALGVSETDITISGYSAFKDDKNQVRQQKRSLKGCLGNAIKLTGRNPSEEFTAFDLNIKNDAFSKLAPGYSGSPLCNQQGKVIGVVTHLRTGELGHALCISNLEILYPSIAKLIPNFKSIDKNTSMNGGVSNRHFWQSFARLLTASPVWISVILILLLGAMISIFYLPASLETKLHTDPVTEFGSISIGSKGTSVLLIQQILKEEGYFTGTPDGLYGRTTESAVAEYQKANGLQPDGILGVVTVTKILELRKNKDKQ